MLSLVLFFCCCVSWFSQTFAGKYNLHKKIDIDNAFRCTKTNAPGQLATLMIESKQKSFHVYCGNAKVDTLHLHSTLYMPRRKKFPLCTCSAFECSVWLLCLRLLTYMLLVFVFRNEIRKSWTAGWPTLLAVQLMLPLIAWASKLASCQPLQSRCGYKTRLYHAVRFVKQSLVWCFAATIVGSVGV